MSDSPYLTVREVARHLEEPLHRVKYAIAEYDILPPARAGIVRLFTRQQLPTIAAAVKRVRERRGVDNAR